MINAKQKNTANKILKYKNSKEFILYLIKEYLNSRFDSKDSIDFLFFIAHFVESMIDDYLTMLKSGKYEY